MTVSEKSRWLILIVLSSALFLIVIDMTVLYNGQHRPSPFQRVPLSKHFRA